ncbi:MAG TPA: hypothetical protein PLR08_02035 [bacterium]|nr:MAG: hypothetical protein H6759_05220 [Candidatus Nomurabacteria bacterium]HPF95309.1 hypothetical protein [bacterium]
METYAQRPVMRDMSQHKSGSSTGDHREKIMALDGPKYPDMKIGTPYDEFDDLTDAKYGEERLLKPAKTPKEERTRAKYIRDNKGVMKEIKITPYRSHLDKPQKPRQLN